MIYGWLIWLVVAPGLVACASGPKKMATRSSIEIETRDVKKLANGLEAAGTEKEIVTLKGDRAICNGELCKLAVIENLPVFIDGKLKGSESLAGHLGFAKADLDLLTKLMEKSLKSKSDEHVDGERGGIYCQGEKCTLKFNLFGEDLLPVSRLSSEKSCDTCR